LALGLQSLQTPAPTHAVHVVPFCQVPVASQVCEMLPLHCFAPGLQTPMHPPAEHTLVVQLGSALVQWPVLSQS
jgi:hypothetical protein